jgi:hypothetical protein
MPESTWMTTREAITLADNLSQFSNLARKPKSSIESAQTGRHAKHR